MGRLFLNIPAEGKAHWAIYKKADYDPEYPWFVEHRLVEEGHPRFEHDNDDSHEYGSFATFADALAAMQQWSEEECKTHCPNNHAKAA